MQTHLEDTKATMYHATVALTNMLPPAHSKGDMFSVVFLSGDASSAYAVMWCVRLSRS